VRPGTVTGSRLCLLRAGLGSPRWSLPLVTGLERSGEDLFDRPTGNERQEEKKSPSVDNEERTTKWIIIQDWPLESAVLQQPGRSQLLRDCTRCGRRTLHLRREVKRGGRLRAPFAAEPVSTRVLVHDSAVVSSGGSFDSFNGGQFIQQLLIARLFFVEPDPQYESVSVVVQNREIPFGDVVAS